MIRRLCKPRWWVDLTKHYCPSEGVKLPALKRCPKCGGINIGYIAERRMDGDGQVRCEDCGHQGPKMKSWLQRITTWNDEGSRQ